MFPSTPRRSPRTSPAKLGTQYVCFDGASAHWVFHGLLRDPSTFTVFGYFFCVMAQHGRLKRPNWMRVSTTDLRLHCHLSQRTVCAALARLVEMGYLIRNGKDHTLYRVPPTVIRCGAPGQRCLVDDARLPLPREVICVDPADYPADKAGRKPKGGADLIDTVSMKLRVVVG